MAIRHDLEVVARSWRHHVGMQTATLVVLTATFSVVVFMLALSENFRRVLTVWGDQVQVSAYLEEGMSPRAIEQLIEDIKKQEEVASVEFVSKEKAADLFRDQMASYAPDLMSDSEFATPFPASLTIRLKSKEASTAGIENLETLAKRLMTKDGVEDVSYGQSWVRNYASFVNVVQTAGIIIGSILLIGSLFIVANSIRALISGRRDEIEILELIGATSQFVRRPYIFEGMILCAVSAALAIAVNGLLFSWQLAIMKKSLAFARIAQEFQYFSVIQSITVVAIAAAVGGIGAWLTVRSLNDGWAAAKKVSLRGAKA